MVSSFQRRAPQCLHFLLLACSKSRNLTVLARQLNVYIPKAQDTKAQSRPVPTTAYKRLPRKERKGRKLLLSTLKQTQKPSHVASSSTKPITKRRIKKHIQAKFKVPSSKFQVQSSKFQIEAHEREKLPPRASADDAPKSRGPRSAEGARRRASRPSRRNA